ncbi:MAG: tetratricopeptide repeat protein [Desulfobulbaceae bacterium]|nr:tetratricopeptide repeat protein [Desulfobulbaceae bacterium]
MFIQQDVELLSSDFNLLYSLFEEKLRRHVSLPGSISYWCGSDIITRHPMEREMLSRMEGVLSTAKNDPDILRREGVLAVSATMDSSGSYGVFFHDMDPALLGKVSESHLSKLRNTVSQCLLSVKQSYLDPLSGRYNSRCLFDLLETDRLFERYGFLFMVKVGSNKRGAEVSLAKCHDIAFLLETVIGKPLVFLSSGIYVFFYEMVSRKNLLEFSRNVVYRLRQNRFFSVHVASSSLILNGEKRIGRKVFKECWKTLEQAERVGPFGFKCGPSVYPDRDERMLTLPADSILDDIKFTCRRHKRFAIILFRVDGNKKDFTGSLERLLSPYLIEQAIIFPVDNSEVYILFPGFTKEDLKDWGEMIKKQDPWCKNAGLLSVGMGYWPCLRYTKMDVVLNCQKALLHGSFYGPGQVTCFDNLSLNVSGDYYFDEGDYREAVKEYRLGLQLQEGDINLMNSLGVALAEVNKPGLAVAWFAKVLDMEPNNYMALVNLGFAMRRKGRKAEAIEYLEKAYLLREKSEESVSELVLQLGDLYCFSGSYGKAAELFRQWEAEKFGLREFHFYRLFGEAQMELGEYREAVRNCQKALRCYPGSTDCMSMLGLLYVKTGQGVEVGLSLCRKAISIDSYDGDHWRRLAYVFLELNDNQEALACARKGLSLKRHDNFRTKLLLGNIYEKMEQDKKAKKIYQNILKSPKISESDVKNVGNRLARLGVREKIYKGTRQ